MIYNRCNRWSRRGVWRQMVEAIAATGEVPSELSLDSTHVKAHGSAAGAEGGWNEAIERPLSGRTLKIYGLADQDGQPVAFGLTPGNVADIRRAVPLGSRCACQEADR